MLTNIIFSPTARRVKHSFSHTILTQYTCKYYDVLKRCKAGQSAPLPRKGAGLGAFCPKRKYPHKSEKLPPKNSNSFFFFFGLFFLTTMKFNKCWVFFFFFFPVPPFSTQERNIERRAEKKQRWKLKSQFSSFCFPLNETFHKNTWKWTFGG